MTSATDELRKLLDEHGVEWTVPDESWNQDSITYWKVGSIKWVAFESENGTIWLNCNSVTDLTPEQAIAATLGAGECEWTLEHSGTLYDKWRCSECGFLYVESRTDVGTTDLDPNFCPQCGARVEGGEDQ